MGESGPPTAACVRVVPRPLSSWPWPASQHSDGTVIPPDHEHRTLPQGSRSPSLLLLPSHLLTFFRTSLGPSLPELTSAHRPARPTARPCLSLFQAESTVALAHLLASHAGTAWTQ